MAIKRHKRGDKVYLAEYKQVREGKKVKSIFLHYIPSSPDSARERGTETNPTRRIGTESLT
jgi:hypothetical protein